jgi:hypothetical protein
MPMEWMNEWMKTLVPLLCITLSLHCLWIVSVDQLAYCLIARRCFFSGSWTGYNTELLTHLHQISRSRINETSLPYLYKYIPLCYRA